MTSDHEPTGQRDGRTLTFDAFGLPAPQGSKRHVGRGVMVESSKAVKPWREAVKYAALEETGKTPLWAAFKGPVVLHVVFYLPRPKSAPKRRWAPDTRPDISKLVRSTEDALTDAGVWHDDGQIVDETAYKRWAEGRPPGAQITVAEAL